MREKKRVVRLRVVPEQYDRLLNAAQYVADVAHAGGNEELAQAAVACITDAMNNSAVYERDIDAGTGVVAYVNLAVSEVTMRNLLAVAEVAPDAHKSGYERGYALLLVEQYRERHRMRLNEHAAQARELADAWGRYTVDGSKDPDDAAVREEFCREHGVAPARMAAIIRAHERKRAEEGADKAFGKGVS